MSENLENAPEFPPENIPSPAGEGGLVLPDSQKKYPQPFLDFWTAYPSHRRGPKHDAFAHWRQIVNGSPQRGIDLINILRNQINARDQIESAGRFTPEFPEAHRWLKPKAKSHWHWTREMEAGNDMVQPGGGNLEWMNEYLQK